MIQNQSNQKKTNWLIIIVAILVILFLGLGAFYFFYLKNKTTSSSTLPTLSPSATTSASPSSLASTNESSEIKVFLIALDDNGKTGKRIGCGDSVVAVNREIPPTQAVLKAAIEELLKIKDRNYGQSGLYNALAPSNLTLESANIVDGTAVVRLKGDLVLSGTCEDPRIVAQLEETTKQFSSIKDAIIYVNGKNLKEITNLR